MSGRGAGYRLWVDPEEARRAIAAQRLWYHTIDVAPGVATPGWFDLRRVVNGYPWPDVRGKRCLDIGTYDGFFAFELEKRGAAEVVCTDIPDHSLWDWPPDMRGEAPSVLAEIAGPEKGAGFKIAKDLLNSKVDRQFISVYDLSPERLGTFDVVVMGSLTLHLEEPLRALEAVRSVCRGQFMSIEQIHPGLTLLLRDRPVAMLNGSGPLLQWWVPNAAGHKRMLFAAGFEIERYGGRSAQPYGVAHKQQRGWKTWRRDVLERIVVGGVGVPVNAVLARPRL